MVDYHDFTSTRQVPPDAVGLLSTLRSTVAADVGCAVFDAQHYRLKKGTTWTPAEIAAAQTVIDGAAALTPQLDAQHAIDDLPLWAKALALTVMDELNLLRAQHG